MFDSGFRINDEVELSTRMIMTPKHAKIFAKKIQEVIEKHNKDGKKQK